jgi:hypothetical protein
MMPSRELREDERGAVMLLALFFAIFALGLLYTVIGAADAAFFRQHLQDASDSVALSSAVMHARSMNFIVLLNIVMAALLAILITIKLIQGLMIVGMAVAAALSWITFGASLAAIPPLHLLQSEMQHAYDTMKPPIFDALGSLHDVADAVKKAGPAAAEAAAADDLEWWKVKSGVIVPANPELPVEDDTFKKLCGEAGTFPAGVIGNVLQPIGVKPIFDALSGAAGDMTASLSAWFCGDDGQSPKPFPYQTEPVYPPPAKECAANATTKDCDAARKIEKQGRPDPHTGECGEEADCSLGGAYDQRVKQARIDCDPTKPDPPEKYFYQERHGAVPYFWTGKAWLRGEPEFQAPTFVTSAEAPCAPKPFLAAIGSSYNSVVRTSDDVADVQPVCSNEQSPTKSGSYLGETTSVAFGEVRHIFGCQKHEDKTVNLDVSGGQGGTEAKESRSPKRVLAGVALGGEPFQIRAIVQNDASALQAGNFLRLALWGRKAPDDTLANVRELGTFAVAEAEYFYDGAEGADAWMWNMSWRARLRRFRLPNDSAKALRDACGESCSKFFDPMSELLDLIVH